MKKSLSIIAVAALATSMFVACGPSKAEIEAKEKAVRDSIVADSTAKAAAEQAKLDSANAAAAAAAKADSIAKVEEAAKAEAEAKDKKGGKK